MSRLARAALLSFLVSRGLLFLLLVVGSQTAFLGKVHAGSVWETRVDLQGERFLPELVRMSMPGDAWWYRSITSEGYGPRKDAGGAPNYAFFPLYPLLIRAVAPGSDYALTGLLLSNVSFGIALFVLGLFARRNGLSEEDAERAIVFLAFFPTSIFCSMPLPESLFLLLSLSSVLAASMRRWPVAAVFGALAALTRLPGILLLVPLTILFFRSDTRPRAKALWLLLVPAGTGAFLFYLDRLTGNPFAFLTVQQNWGRRPGLFWMPLWRYVSNPTQVGEPWNLIAMNFAFALLVLAAGIGLIRQRRWDLGAYTLASLLLPLSTGSLQSLGRYAVVVFPIYLWLAIAARKPLVDRLGLATLVMLFGWLTAMFILRVDFAMA
jgi:Gpi18-like mannosyltransferase